MRNRILDHVVGIVIFLPMLIASLFKRRGNKQGLRYICPYSAEPCEHSDGETCTANLTLLLDCPLDPNEIMLALRAKMEGGIKKTRPPALRRGAGPLEK